MKGHVVAPPFVERHRCRWPSSSSARLECVGVVRKALGLHEEESAASKRRGRPRRRGSRRNRKLASARKGRCPVGDIAAPAPAGLHRAQPRIGRTDQSRFSSQLRTVAAAIRGSGCKNRLSVASAQGGADRCWGAVSGDGGVDSIHGAPPGKNEFRGMKAPIARAAPSARAGRVAASRSTITVAAVSGSRSCSTRTREYAWPTAPPRSAP